MYDASVVCGSFAAVMAASPLAKFLEARSLRGRKLAQASRSGRGVRNVRSELWVISNPELKELTGLEVCGVQCSLAS